ncbi:MAG: Ig-like domain-containing protein [Bacteroidota bacterium]
MRKLIHQFLFLLCLFGGVQLSAQDIDFTVRFNPTSGNYEVYALPDFSDPAYFVGGGTQISLVLPNSIADAPLSITTVNGGIWTDNSQVYAPTADPAHDFHGIASNGSIISLVAGQELLLYTFTLPGGNCVGGLRLFINGSDPNSAAAGMGGGDFENYFANVFTFVDNYNANYNNTGTSCNPPVVIPNPIVIPQDSTGTICAPISDPDAGDTFTATSCGASNGTETVTVNGNEVCVTYTPNSGFTGTDSVCIIVCDQLGACDTTTVPVVVVPPLPPSVTPEPPVVIVTPITTPEDSSTTVCTPILDPNAGDTFTANLCTGSPENGTANLMVMGNQLCVEYEPNPGFTGDDEVCVIVCDQTGLCDTVEIPITVVPTVEPPTTPQPPIVVFPPVVTPEDSTVTTCGPIIDANPLDTHTVTICQQPANGMATAAVDNMTGQLCVTFGPEDNFSGTDSICVIVCDQTGLCDTVNIPVEVTPANDAPVAIDDVNQTQIDQPVTGDLLTNDIDPDGDSLIVNTTPIGTPTGGTVTINPDGTYEFTPTPGFTGEGTFDYEVCDDGSPQLCDTATVVIEVIDNTNPDNNPPVGTEDNLVTEEGDPIMGDLLSNDNDPDGDSLIINTTPVTPPTDGMLTINPDGTYMYTPDPDFEGEDSFEYEVCDDGMPVKCDTVKVTITVLPDDGENDTYATDDAGMGNENENITGNVLANDTDPEGDMQTATATPVSGPMNGTLTINPDGSYEYEPNPGFTGNDEFVYQVCDNGTPVACDSATVYLTVIDVNEVIAIDDINVTPKDSTVMGNVLTNDDDPEGDSLIVSTTPVGTPVGGTVTINPDGSYEFVPTFGFTGEARFQYEVCDDGSPVACDTAEVTIEVFDNTDPNNNPVVGVEDNFVTEEGAPVTGSLTDNDFDPDGDNITINTTPVTPPTDGMLTINPDGTFTYTPDPDFTGEDTFEYQVCDDGTPQTCDTVKVTIEVLPDNGMNDVYATDDAETGTKNSPIVGDVSTNDNDPEGDNLTFAAAPVVAPANGSVTINPDGSFTYTPNTDFTGADQFVYQVCDDGTPQACDTATVYLTITEGGFPPVVLPNPLTIPQDSTGNICVPITDPNFGDTFTATSCGADDGTETVTVNGNEVCVEYEPNPGFNGTDSVCIIVCDQTGLCDTTFIPVTVVAPLPPSVTPEPPVVTPTTGTTPEDSTVTVCTPILDPNIGETFNPPTLCAGSPANGTATPTINGNELCIEYTPDNGFTGTDEVCIIVCDDDGLCDTIDIPITVIPTIQPPTTPQPPVVVFPPVVTPEDITTTVCGPIVDPNTGDTHTVTICEQPANGTATAAVNNMNGDVCVTFDPDPGFTGMDSICIIVCDQTNLCDTVNIPVLIVPSPVKLNLKVMLQGAMLFTSDGLMRDDLRTQGLIPLNQPYSSALSSRFTHVGGGGESTTNLILSQNFGTPDAIVDWVFIEIRDATNNATVVRTISALVQRDGDVVDAATGMTPCILGLPASFHVAVKHRNHLGAMTANVLTPTMGNLVVDFTTMGDADLYHFGGYDGLEMTTMSGKRALWAGNANADNKVKYDGGANDRIKLANDVLTFPANSGFNLNYDNAIEYLQGDIDLSGKAKYDGGSNDRILIQNIVLTFPLNTLTLNNYNDLLEQLP